MTETREKKFVPKQFDNLGSLVTYEHAGQTCCLGYLMHFEGKGTYDATYGRVDISKEHADAHNAAYDKAQIEGLDSQCQIGQGSWFYVHEQTSPVTVKTFLGTVLNEGAVTVKMPTKGKGVHILFNRKGRVFKGRFKRQDGTSVFFTRIG